MEWSKTQCGTFKDLGFEAYVKRLMSTMLEQRSDKCYFVGYPKETRGYYFYKPSEGIMLLPDMESSLKRILSPKKSVGEK
jgi:hypothetical protein